MMSSLPTRGCQPAGAALSAVSCFVMRRRPPASRTGPSGSRALPNVMHAVGAQRRGVDGTGPRT
eukprot:2610428-Alexandrium_andersonii.AAC.1